MATTQAAGPAAMAVDATPGPMARPGVGRAGRKVMLDANFFRVSLPSVQVVSQYHIVINALRDPATLVQGSRGGPKVDNLARCDVAKSALVAWNRAVFAAVCRKYRQSVGSNVAYDGRSVAYAPREINRSVLGTDMAVRVGKEGEEASADDVANNRFEEVSVRFEHATYIDLKKVMDARQDVPENTSAALAALDVVLAMGPMLTHVQVGRSFYHPEGASHLDNTASAWRGFYQSARLSQLGLIVNIDESRTAFWNGGGTPLEDFVARVNGGQPLKCGDQFRLKDVGKKLDGLKVRAAHSKITYRVHGFSTKGANQITFMDASVGREVSVAEYFQNHYNVRLQRPNQPCVRTNVKRGTFVPMEVLTVVEKQRMSNALTPAQTTAMIKCAATKPDKRRDGAVAATRRANHNQDPVCKDFGVSVQPGLVQGEGRVLPPPSMEYRVPGGSVQAPKYTRVAPREGAGSWQMGNRDLLRFGCQMYSWAIINISRARQDVVERFAQGLSRKAKSDGVDIIVHEPRIYNCRQDRIEQQMKDVASEFRRDEKLRVGNRQLQLIVIIKDKVESQGYNLIKRVGDLELGIVTQICLEKNVFKANNQYFGNVILKINAKLGGQNFVALTYPPASGIPKTPFEDVPHIILGADVTHPSPGGRSPSVAALVGSKDRHGTQYTGSIRNQPSRQEIIPNIGEMFKEVYFRWRNHFHNKHHARSIIMFRDGVSEGQFDQVMQVEINALRRSIAEYDPAWKPRITYIIVTKRHHARFFPKKGQGDRSGNIMPGTVIDTGITSRTYYDFYLNSHAGIQGTSRPAKYTVLVDENNISVDSLQGFIFRLSHSYVRCTRSVSMVNAAYYAHLLAFRGRAYLADDNSDNGSVISTESANVVPPTSRAHAVVAERLYWV